MLDLLRQANRSVINNLPDDEEEEGRKNEILSLEAQERIFREQVAAWLENASGAEGELRTSSKQRSVENARLGGRNARTDSIDCNRLSHSEANRLLLRALSDKQHLMQQLVVKHERALQAEQEKRQQVVARLQQCQRQLEDSKNEIVLLKSKIRKCGILLKHQHQRYAEKEENYGEDDVQENGDDEDGNINRVSPNSHSLLNRDDEQLSSPSAFPPSATSSPLSNKPLLTPLVIPNNNSISGNSSTTTPTTTTTSSPANTKLRCNISLPPVSPCTLLPNNNGNTNSATAVALLSPLTRMGMINHSASPANNNSSNSRRRCAGGLLAAGSPTRPFLNCWEGVDALSPSAAAMAAAAAVGQLCSPSRKNATSPVFPSKSGLIIDNHIEEECSDVNNEGEEARKGLNSNSSNNSSNNSIINNNVNQRNSIANVSNQRGKRGSIIIPNESPSHYPFPVSSSQHHYGSGNNNNNSSSSNGSSLLSDGGIFPLSLDDSLSQFGFWGALWKGYKNTSRDHLFTSEIAKQTFMTSLHIQELDQLMYRMLDGNARVEDFQKLISSQEPAVRRAWIQEVGRQTSISGIVMKILDALCNMSGRCGGAFTEQSVIGNVVAQTVCDIMPSAASCKFYLLEPPMMVLIGSHERPGCHSSEDANSGSNSNNSSSNATSPSALRAATPNRSIGGSGSNNISNSNSSGNPFPELWGASKTVPIDRITTECLLRGGPVAMLSNERLFALRSGPGGVGGGVGGAQASASGSSSGPSSPAAANMMFGRNNGTSSNSGGGSRGRAANVSSTPLRSVDLLGPNDMIACPIRRAGDSIGVLIVTVKSSVSRADILALTAASSQAGRILESHLIVNTAWDSTLTSRLRLLLDFVGLVRTKDQLVTLLKNIVSKASILIGCERHAVFLREDINLMNNNNNGGGGGGKSALPSPNTSSSVHEAFLQQQDSFCCPTPMMRTVTDEGIILADLKMDRSSVVGSCATSNQPVVVQDVESDSRFSLFSSSSHSLLALAGMAGPSSSSTSSSPLSTASTTIMTGTAPRQSPSSSSCALSSPFSSSSTSSSTTNAGNHHQSSVRNLLAVPFHNKHGQVIGVIQLFNKGWSVPQPWTHADVELLQTFAHYCGILTENSSFSPKSSIVNKWAEVRSLLQRAELVLDVDAVKLFVIDRESGTMTARGPSGIYDDRSGSPMRYEISLCNGVAGRVAVTGNALLLGVECSAFEDPRYKFDVDHAFRSSRPCETLMSFPVLTRGISIAVLHAINKKSGRPFSLEDEAFMQVLVDRLQILLETDEVIENMRREAEENQKDF